mmetsp:Transcript_24918/g.37096  ORF Transcript_24918/g.37096 Transcript_24918/m.37096 type:complete len:139 (+) Transcript_24918:589-1005(+)
MEGHMTKSARKESPRPGNMEGRRQRQSHCKNIPQTTWTWTWTWIQPWARSVLAHTFSCAVREKFLYSKFLVLLAFTSVPTPQACSKTLSMQAGKSHRPKAAIQPEKGVRDARDAKAVLVVAADMEGALIRLQSEPKIG